MFGNDILRDLVGAEFWAAHRAEFRFLEDILWQCLVMVLFGAIRVEAELELPVPVEAVTRITHLIVDLPGIRTATGNIRCMGCNLIGDDSLPDIGGVGKPKMLFGGDIAEHTGAMPSANRCTDRGRDMVIPRRYIRDQRPQYIERGFVAIFALQFHISLYLIERHMPRAFDHHLDIFFPGSECQFAQNFQFGKLRIVTGIVEASRSETVAQRKGNIIFAADIEDLVIGVIERVLFMVMHHPGSHQ